MGLGFEFFMKRILAIVKQGLYGTKAFSAPQLTLQLDIWGCTRIWEKTHPVADGPSWPQRNPLPHRIVLHNKAEEKRKNLWSDGIYVPKSLLHVIELCFTGGGWTPTCPWEVMNEFLVVLICLPAQLFFLLPNCLYHEFSPFCSSDAPCVTGSFLAEEKQWWKKWLEILTNKKWACKLSPPPD